jgi:hypothetical protein
VLENVDEKTVVDNQDKHHAARINKMRGQSMFLGVTHGHLQIPALKHAKKCNVKYLTEMMKFSLHPEARLQSRSCTKAWYLTNGKMLSYITTNMLSILVYIVTISYTKENLIIHHV